MLSKQNKAHETFGLGRYDKASPDENGVRTSLFWMWRSHDGGSVWESNPPGACFQTPHRF